MWSSPSVDFIGVDAYWPLGDWRDGRDHLDAQEARSIYDRAFLSRRVSSGPDFDWFYASEADRAAQIRTPITDGAYGKPWVFRAKDLVGWWSNPHKERVGGVETATTAWTPRSKPIWLVEIGCPAVDRGANQPNVFPDPKSSESAAPHFSRDTRDDLMLIAANEAILAHFDPAHPLFVAADNPVSPIYGGRMVEPSRIHAWAWDARPFPAFPFSRAWSDAANWAKGHWLTGRVESAPLDRLVADHRRRHGRRPDDDRRARGRRPSRRLRDRPADVAARPIEPLMALFGFDARTRAGQIDFIARDHYAVTALADDESRPRPRRRDHRADARAGDRTAARGVDHDHRRRGRFPPRHGRLARRIGASRRETRNDLAAVMQTGEAQRRLDALLYDFWAARDRASFPCRRRVGADARRPRDAAGDHRQGLPHRAHRRRRSPPHRGARDRSRDLRRDARRTDRDAPRRASSSPEAPARRNARSRRGSRRRRRAHACRRLRRSWPGPVAIWREGRRRVRPFRTLARCAIVGGRSIRCRRGRSGRIDRAPSPRVPHAGRRAVGVQRARDARRR
ncbi:MAG: glycoside hydrolase TIM-barrel-like domain-containing protein [Rhizobiales bacterium]|nr:glycoside hydrolase TIM-barrel-like domain-containing protein [Hyphomicrobiales bacterium]